MPDITSEDKYVEETTAYMPNKFTLKQFEKDELTTQMIFTVKSDRRMLVEQIYFK